MQGDTQRVATKRPPLRVATNFNEKSQLSELFFRYHKLVLENQELIANCIRKGYCKRR